MFSQPKGIEPATLENANTPGVYCARVLFLASSENRIESRVRDLRKFCPNYSRPVFIFWFLLASWRYLFIELVSFEICYQQCWVAIINRHKLNHCISSGKFETLLLSFEKGLVGIVLDLKLKGLKFEPRSLLQTTRRFLPVFYNREYWLYVYSTIFLKILKKKKFEDKCFLFLF